MTMYTPTLTLPLPLTLTLTRARLRYSAMAREAACDAAARRVQAALRGCNCRRALPPRAPAAPPSEPPGWLLGRPAYAAPLGPLALGRVRRPELVVAVRA